MKTHLTRARLFFLVLLLVFGGGAPAVAADRGFTVTFDRVVLWTVVGLCMLWEIIKPRKEVKPDPPPEKPATPPHVWVGRLVLLALLVWAVLR